MKQTKFAGNVFKLSSAPVLTQIISFFLLPLISRLYSPENFGVFNIFGASVSVIGVFVGLGYHTAIVLPNKGRDAYFLLKSSIVFTGILGILLLGLIVILPQSVFVKFKMAEYFEYKYYIFYTVILHGLSTSFLGWNLRNKNFGSMAAARVINVIANKGFIIFVGLLGYAFAVSLIIGQVIGQLLMVALLMFAGWKSYKEYFKTSYSKDDFIKLLTRYIQFPIYAIGTDLFFRISQTLTLLLIVYWFTDATVGTYGMAITILSIPTTLIGSAVGEVYYQQLPIMISERKGAEFSVKLFSILISTSLIVFTILTIYGDVLLPFALGDKWQETGIIVSILSFGIFIQFLVGPFQNILKIFDKQQYLFLINVALFVVSVGAISIGGLLKSFYLAFGFFSVGNGVVSLIFGLYIFKLLDVSLKKISLILLKYFLFIAPFVIILLCTKYWFGDSIIISISLCILSLVTYYLALLFFDSEFQSLLKPIIKKLTSPKLIN